MPQFTVISEPGGGGKEGKERMEGGGGGGGFRDDFIHHVNCGQQRMLALPDMGV